MLQTYTFEKIESEGLTNEQLEALTEGERVKFTHWILSNWDNKHHNFTIKKDGEYFYSDMQDAWQIWFDARIDLIDDIRLMGGLHDLTSYVKGI